MEQPTQTSSSTSQSQQPASAPEQQQQPQPPAPTPPPAIATSSSSPSQSSSSSSLPSTSSSTIQSPQNPNPNPNPNPKPPTQMQQQSTSQNPQNRTPFNRPWQQPSHFSQFSSHIPHSSSTSSPSPSPMPSFSSSVTSSLSAPPAQRGGMAIGVPAHHPSPPTPPSSFSSMNPPSFGQQFGGLGRSTANVPDSITSSSLSQVRQPMQGMQGMGTMGSFGSGSQMRPGGVAAHHQQQQRPGQPSLRPTSTPNNQSTASQNFQGHNLLRVSSMGSPGSPSPGTPQSAQPHTQPWLSSASQGKPPLPSAPFRAPMHAPSMQQRSHIPQQHHHPISTAAQQQQSTSAQQPASSHSPKEHFGQQFSPRVTQSITQQLLSKVPPLVNQKPSSHGVVQSSAPQSGPPNRATSPETIETCNRILSKRTIQELVNQIDPSENLDPEVEDILVDIADEFVESITTFGCSLAKHRKSNTLEAKDILLHLERNWNMTLPGFSGDEIKIFKKPIASDIHRERLAAIKKSMTVAEAGAKSSAGHVAGSAKGHLAKASTNTMGSPTPKLREAA